MCSSVIGHPLLVTIHRYPGLQFSYHTPHEGFDHNKVYGVVAKLVDLTDHKYATALEVTAGGKVIVDNYGNWCKYGHPLSYIMLSWIQKRLLNSC